MFSLKMKNGLKGTKLGIGALYEHLYQREMEGRARSEQFTIVTEAHRALPDVEGILTHPRLAHCLSLLSKRTSTEQRRPWQKQKIAHTRTSTLVKSLGKLSITSAQARRLDDLGFSHWSLVALAGRSKDVEDF